jgi:tetratricopeptide (TPR) repeat protein
MKQEAQTLISQGLSLQEAGDPGGALILLEDAARKAKEESREDVLGDAFFQMGKIHFDGEAYQEAGDCWLQASGLYARTGNPSRKADADYNLGHLHMARGDADRAVYYFTEAYSHYLKEEDPRPIADSGFNAAISAMEQETLNFEGAYDALFSAIDKYEELGDREAVADGLYHAGKLFYRTGELAQAVIYFKKSAAEYKKLKIDSRLADCHFKLGNTFLDMGRPREASEELEKAADIYGRCGENAFQAESILNMGTACEDMKDFDRARQYYDQAHSAFVKEGDDKGAGDALFNRGLMEEDQGNSREALKQYTKALNCYRRASDLENQGETYFNMGRVYQGLDDLENSRHFYKQALISYEKCGSGQKAANTRKKMAETLSG